MKYGCNYDSPLALDNCKSPDKKISKHCIGPDKAPSIPRHMMVAEYYDIILALCLSVHPSVIRPSVFSLQDDNLSKCQWIFTKRCVH